MVGLFTWMEIKAEKWRNQGVWGKNKNWKMERREDKRVWSSVFDHKHLFVPKAIIQYTPVCVYLYHVNTKLTHLFFPSKFCKVIWQQRKMI